MDIGQFYSAVGQRIVAARKARGLTQEALALKMKMSRPAIANMERGAQRLPLHVAVRLKAILGLPDIEALLPPVTELDVLADDKVKIFGPADGVSADELSQIERIYESVDSGKA